jgi:flagellar motor switch protein FliN/FliY
MDPVASITPEEMSKAVDAAVAANPPVQPASTEIEHEPDSRFEHAEPLQAAAARLRENSEAAEPFEQPEFPRGKPEGGVASIDLLDDVDLNVKVELGRTEMYIEDVLRLGVGSVVELDRSAGDPVDILVNERLVARGEVLVLNDNFCVRINEIISPVPEGFEGC